MASEIKEPHHKIAKPITPIRTRYDLPQILNEEGFEVGAELGVQAGRFAEHILKNWVKGKKYYLVDVWKQQENYKDQANVSKKGCFKIRRSDLNRLRIRLYSCVSSQIMPLRW